jgi:hypothetical protein
MKFFLRKNIDFFFDSHGNELNDLYGVIQERINYSMGKKNQGWTQKKKLINNKQTVGGYITTKP